MNFCALCYKFVDKQKWTKMLNSHLLLETKMFCEIDLEEKNLHLEVNVSKFEMKLATIGTISTGVYGRP